MAWLLTIATHNDYAQLIMVSEGDLSLQQSDLWLPQRDLQILQSDNTFMQSDSWLPQSDLGLQKCVQLLFSTMC